MKKVFIIISCLVSACSGMYQSELQQRMINTLLTHTNYYSLEEDGLDVIKTLTASQNTLDINTYSEYYRTTLLHKVTSNIVDALLDGDQKKFDHFNTIYTTMVKLFKTKINVNVENTLKETPLFVILKHIKGKILETNAKPIENFLAAFVTEFKETIDFDSNHEGKKFFDLFDLKPIISKTAYSEFDYMYDCHLQKAKRAEEIVRIIYNYYKENLKK